MAGQSGQQISLIGLIIILISLSGCTGNPDILVDHPQRGLGESPDFSHVWAIALSKSGIDNRTAELGNLLVWLDGNASIDSLLMDFSGKKGGVMKLYRLDVSPGGRINVQCLEERSQNPFHARFHPMTILSALEELPIQTIDPSGNGLSIWTGPMCCDIGYYREYAPIFEIRNGSLIPIKRIVLDLPSGESIYPIHVCGHTTDPVAVTGSIDEFVDENKFGVHCWTLFIPEDVVKAGTATTQEGTRHHFSMRGVGFEPTDTFVTGS